MLEVKNAGWTLRRRRGRSTTWPMAQNEEFPQRLDQPRDAGYSPR